MTSHDDIAELQRMRDRGDITDDEYMALRRYVLWGTPLPPGMSPGPPPRHRPPDTPAAAPPPGRRGAGRGEPYPPRARYERERRDARGDGYPGQDHEPRGYRRPQHGGPAHDPGARIPLPPHGGTGHDRRRGAVPDPPSRPDLPVDGWARHPQRDGRPHRQGAQQVDLWARPSGDGARGPAPGPAPDRARGRAPGAELAVRDAAPPARRPGAAPAERPRTRTAPPPGRARRRLALLVSATLVLCLVGVGVWWFVLRSAPVQPDVYAHRVCTTVSGWQHDFAGEREKLVTVLGNGSLEVSRDAVVTFFQNAEQRTASLSVDLARIGPPNVRGGATYAKALRQATATAASSFHDAAEQARGLDVATKDVFTQSVQTQVASIDGKTRPIFDALGGRGIDPPLALRTAFDAEPTCAPYTG